MPSSNSLIPSLELFYIASSSPRQHENTLRFEVTPTTEAEIRCFIGGASSQAVYIAGECSKPVN